MAERKPPVGQRVDVLEDRVAKLERLTERVRRDQRETFKQIKELRDSIVGLPAKVKSELDHQTDAFRVIVAESETANADRISELARQWPAGAIIVATAAAAVLANLLLAAAHLPHLS